MADCGLGGRQNERQVRQKAKRAYVRAWVPSNRQWSLAKRLVLRLLLRRMQALGQLRQIGCQKVNYYMRRFVFERFAMALISLGLVVMAARLLPAEMAHVGEEGRKEVLVFLNAENETPRFAPVTSIVGQVGQMSECDDLLLSVYPALLGDGATKSVAQACLDRADEILRDAPAIAAAHLVRAGALWRLGAPAKAVEALALSARLATNEGWMAARRVRLGIRLDRSVHTAVDPQLSADMLTVLQDDKYHPLLVQLYLEFPDQQKWMVAQLSNGAESDQGRFLYGVRMAAAKNNPVEESGQ